MHSIILFVVCFGLLDGIQDYIFLKLFNLSSGKIFSKTWCLHMIAAAPLTIIAFIFFALLGLFENLTLLHSAIAILTLATMSTITYLSLLHCFHVKNLA